MHKKAFFSVHCRRIFTPVTEEESDFLHPSDLSVQEDHFFFAWLKQLCQFLEKFDGELRDYIWFCIEVHVY